jgi:hypothetical protein
MKCKPIRIRVLGYGPFFRGNHSLIVDFLGSWITRREVWQVWSRFLLVSLKIALVR